MERGEENSCKAVTLMSQLPDFLYKDCILQLHCSLTKRWILENVQYLKLIWFSRSNEENHTKL